MRPTKALLVAGLLLLGTSACGSDTPAGTLTQDDVSGSAKAESRDHIANQVNCQGIDEAEDAIMDAAPDYEKGKTPAVVFDLTGDGKDHEWVDSSVWLVDKADQAVEAVSAGIDECVKQYPDRYQRIDPPEDFPDAVGYAAMEDDPPVYTRRILVPLKDRVVVVGARREGSADFAVRPEELVGKAVKAAEDVPQD